MQDLNGRVALVNGASASMKRSGQGAVPGSSRETLIRTVAAESLERIFLAHIAQELLWDPGLISLESFTKRQRGRIKLMLRRMVAEGADETGKRTEQEFCALSR